MTTTGEARLSQQEEYLTFKALKDQTEALTFVKNELPSPIGKSYYTPTDYRWATMPLRARLVEAHSRRWFSIWGLLHMKNKPQDDERFEEQERLVIKAMVSELDTLRDWVNSRYSIPDNSYLMPNRFATFKEEANGDWDLEDTLDSIKNGPYREHYGAIRYYWKKVEPAQEDPADERRHVILMDMDTHEEAPLLPGVVPYRGSE
jgi:hypothetical protein